MKNLAQEMEPPVPQEEIEAADTPVEAAEPEAKAEEPKEEKQEAEQVKVVPHQALHEERQRRKEAQAEIARLRQEQAQRDAILSERLNQLYQASQPQPQLRDPQQDPDPLAAMAHNQQLTLQQLADLQKRVATEDWQRQQAQAAQQLVGWAQQQAVEFKAEKPDFDQAYNHVKSIRMGELQAMNLSPQQIAQTLYQDEMWVLQHAAQSGKNPAEILYNMAERTGYKLKQEQAPAEQKMETLQKGTQAAKTLGSGGAPAGTPTPEQIANMNDEEFEKLKADLRAKGKRISDII